MEYNWNIEDIKELKRKTKLLLRKTKSLTKEEKELLLYSIYNLKEMEHMLLPSKVNFKFPKLIRYLDHDHFLSKYNYLSYDSIPYFLKQSVLNATTYFGDYVSDDKEIILPKIDLSDKELVELSHDFYNSLPNKEYVRAFDFYTNPNNNLLRFKFEENLDLFGDTTTFYYPSYKPYFYIARNNTITDFLTLNHEIAHGIMCANASKGHNYYLDELEGFFFEFLSIKFLKNIISDDTLNNLQLDSFNITYEDFISFYITDLAINLFDEKKDISTSHIQNQLLKNNLSFDLDDEMLKCLLRVDPVFTAKYLISFLTSLDLEIIYESDPEYAFYIFEKIRSNNTNNIFKNLEDNGISFIGQNENYVPLQKKIDYMNQLNKK